MTTTTTITMTKAKTMRTRIIIMITITMTISMTISYIEAVGSTPRAWIDEENQALQEARTIEDNNKTTITMTTTITTPRITATTLT